MSDNVNHPKHYNIPGRKECIVEMLEKFGIQKVENFCELNSYKYNYRYELKNGDEDLKKAGWYDGKLLELENADPRFKIADHYGLRVQEQQLIEEMAELTQVICKDKRSKGEGQAINGTWKYSDIKKHLIEELGDVRLMLDQVIYLLDVEDDVERVINEKIERTLERMDDE